MYAFESSGSRKSLHMMVIGAFVVGILLFSLSNQPGVPLPSLWQCLAALTLSVGVYLCVRYSLAIYRYAVESSGITDADGAEQYDLIITVITGKKQRTVTRIALREIDRDRVSVLKRSDKRENEIVRRSYGAETRVFTYANVPILAEACVIPVPEEKSILLIPVDAGMYRILKGE